MWLITKSLYMVIWISVTKEEYFVSETTSAWSEEKDEKCTFAKPPLTFSQDKVTAQLVDFDTANDKIWVGYFRKNTGFEYFGCVAETDIAPNAALAGSSKDPGYCFTICKQRGASGIIGIFNTTCFCLGDIQEIILTQSYCTLECTSGTGVACGGVLGTKSFVSLYRLNFNDQNVYGLLANNPWINATVLCFSNNSLPANYTASMTAVVNTLSQLWTGVIRSHVIYDFIDRNLFSEGPSHSDIEYGYLTKSGTAYVLQFEKTDIERRKLCERRTTITSHTDRNQDSSVTVPVVVSVSVLLIVAISLAALVVLRRRGKIPNICGNTNSTSSTAHQTKYESSIKETTEGNQYEQVDDIIKSNTNRSSDEETYNTNYAHTYFVLEKVENQPDKEDAHEIHAREMKSSNVYNTLEHDVDKKRKPSKTLDNTYDTTETVAEKLKSKFGEDSDTFGDTGENLYNRTNSAPMKNNKTDTVYNVSEDNVNAYVHTDTKHENKVQSDDDTYNHIET